jgi:hypothetical protein
LQQEKEQVIRKKDSETDQIRAKLDEVIKEKQKAVLNHKEDLEQRDIQIESMRLAAEDSNNRLEKEKATLRSRNEE